MKFNPSLLPLFRGVFKGALAIALTTNLAMAADAPPSPTDITKRYLIVHNEMPSTVYPVIEVPEDGNCKPGSTSVNRIVVPGGVATGKTVKIYMPDKCWYNAGRIFIFTPNIEAFESRIDPTQQTKKGSTAACYEVNADKTDGLGVNCYLGSAASSYPLDSPAQLTEYTFDADDPVTGQKSSDPDKGRLMTDIDLSYVDETFLPVAMAIDTGGTAGFMGTSMSYADFNQRVAHFLQAANWSQFAAYTRTNWPNNAFNDLISPTYHTMGGYNLFNSVNTKATSNLYKVTPLPPPKPTPLPYFIENLTVDPSTYQPVNPSVTALTARWQQWLTGNPCAGGKAPANPAADQQGFCQDFQATVKWVWDQYMGFKANDPNYCKYIGGDAKPYIVDNTECLIHHIMGYTQGPNSGQLPESVQAILRGVPWNDPSSGKPLYQYDKWLLFWAPYDSPYNLNPFTRLIHDPTDGINAVAYSFSIDDKYGNFRDEGTGLIIDVGGNSYLPNKVPYDPYQQYFVTWAANSWDHATVCGRDITINKRAGNARVSMWQNGNKQDNCDVVLYTTADNGGPHLNFRLSEESMRSVTDAYTGKSQQVQGLTTDVNYCKENSSPTMITYCDQANLSPVYKGDIAYVSLSDGEKPKTTLNVAALVTGVNLNLAPGWTSGAGCGLPAAAGKIDPKNGSSFALAPGAENACQVNLTGDPTKNQAANLTVLFNPDGTVTPSSVTCTKANQAVCVGVVVTPNGINLPPPDGI